MFFLCFVCLIWFFTSHQQSFSYIGTGLPGLKQYWARINVSCSRTTTQWRRWGSNPRPFGLESSTLPLSHCAPIFFFCVVFAMPLCASVTSFRSIQVRVTLLHIASDQITGIILPPTYVPMAMATRDGSDEPARPHSLARGLHCTHT